MTTSLLLVDDRELFREGFHRLLATQPEFDVVGEASQPPAAYELVAAHHPDVVIVSSDLDGVGAIGVVRELLRRQTDGKVLMLSSRSDDDGVHQTLAAGARGFALKHQSSAQVFEAVRA